MTAIIHDQLDQIRRFVGGSRRVEPGFHQAKVVSVCTRKGGVGKTTTAVNLAAGLASKHGKKVLLVDMDAQGHCGTALHNVLRGATPDSVSSVVLGKRRELQEVALPTGVSGLWVTPSDKGLNATEGIMAGRIGKEFLLRSAMKVTRTHYDVIVIDCPPNLGNLTLNALMASDSVLIPCDMSVLSLEGVSDILETVDTLDESLGHNLRVLGILRTRFDRRNQKVNQTVESSLKERHGALVLNTRIPVNTRLSQAQNAGQPIFQFDPDCRGSAAYGEALDELVVRLRL